MSVWNDWKIVWQGSDPEATTVIPESVLPASAFIVKYHTLFSPGKLQYTFLGDRYDSVSFITYHLDKHYKEKVVMPFFIVGPFVWYYLDNREGNIFYKWLKIGDIVVNANAEEPSERIMLKGMLSDTYMPLLQEEQTLDFTFIVNENCIINGKELSADMLSATPSNQNVAHGLLVGEKLYVIDSSNPEVIGNSYTILSNDGGIGSNDGKIVCNASLNELPNGTVLKLLVTYAWVEIGGRYSGKIVAYNLDTEADAQEVANFWRDKGVVVNVYHESNWIWQGLLKWPPWKKVTKWRVVTRTNMDKLEYTWYGEHQYSFNASSTFIYGLPTTGSLYVAGEWQSRMVNVAIPKGTRLHIDQATIGFGTNRYFSIRTRIASGKISSIKRNDCFIYANLYIDGSDLVIHESYLDGVSSQYLSYKVFPTGSYSNGSFHQTRDTCMHIIAQDNNDLVALAFNSQTPIELDDTAIEAGNDIIGNITASYKGNIREGGGSVSGSIISVDFKDERFAYILVNSDGIRLLLVERGKGEAYTEVRDNILVVSDIAEDIKQIYYNRTTDELMALTYDKAVVKVYKFVYGVEECNLQEVYKKEYDLIESACFVSNSATGNISICVTMQDSVSTDSHNLDVRDILSDDDPLFPGNDAGNGKRTEVTLVDNSDVNILLHTESDVPILVLIGKDGKIQLQQYVGKWTILDNKRVEDPRAETLWTTI